MKISKLFHWLYAILMLMPIFAIGVSCLYVIFNKNAKDSYYGETINEIEYKPVDNYILNKNYHFQNDGYEELFVNSYIYLTNITNYEFPVIGTNFQIALDNNTVYKLEFTNYNNQPLFKFFKEDDFVYSLQNFAGATPFQFDFDLLTYTTSTDILDLFVKEITYNKYTYLDNVFYYSIVQLKNNSLFNWSKDSFLAQPITYITDLFGMDNDNIVIYLLSYWLDISIIWLVFDLVMYVPLVIHRWIDKGVLE